MSFGQKPPNAWGRQTDFSAPQNQQLNPNLFTNQLGLAQPFGNPAMTLAPGINALVNQAAFSNNLNMLAQAQRQLIPQNVPQQRQMSPPQGSKPNQRTFVGVVTKLMDTYGFIDEDVFFQTSVIRGALPRVGDRVMVEATFNPSMPFKWNAHRIQLIQDGVPPQQQQQQQQPPPQAQHISRQPTGQISHVVHPPGNRWTTNERVVRDDSRGATDRHRVPAHPPRRSPPRRDERRSPPPRRSPLPRRSSPRKQSPPPRRAELPKRERTPPRASREPRARSPVPPKVREADSPPRRRQRIIPRYQCYIPRSVVSRNLTYAELHKRYPALYIPSDFVHCEMTWPDAFCLDDPITFAPSCCDFHVAHKDVDVPLAEGDVLPLELTPDADSRFIVKVLLLTHPGASAIREKITGLLPDGTIDESMDVQTLAKVLHFIIGIRGKNEVMGIGGTWSPSLDGEDPSQPQTLINTAIRTTRAMTGIDLTNCPSWYKLIHLRYYRADRDRTDSVVLMLPDTSAMPNLQPSAEDYRQLVEETLPGQLRQKLAAIDAEPFVPVSEVAKKVAAFTEKELSKTSDAAATTNDEQDSKMETEPAVAESAPADSILAVEPAVADVAPVVMDTSHVEENSETNGVIDTSMNEGDVEDGDRTHWSLLNVKAMKVVELRQQLTARGLDVKGVKNALAQRLQEALDSEKAQEEGPASKADLVLTDELAEGVDQPDDTPINTADLIVKDELDEKMDTADEPVVVKQEVIEEDTPVVPVVEGPPKVEITDKEKAEYKKEVDKFEKSKKDRKAALERHYVFPKNPCVLIYPSKVAKAGKFECRISSLQSLLDYRLDDSKEASFEVFLMAEAFREALDRSNAFTVYYTLHAVLDKEAERKRRDEALNKPVETEEITQENGVVDGEKTEGKAESVKDDKARAESVKDDKSSKEEKAPVDPRINFKAVVSDIHTFQAFAHFDQNICGYLNDRDLEEIIYSIGLNVSRSFVQRLIKKVSSRDRFNYRNVTDKWLDKDGTVKYVPEFIADPPARSILLKGNYFESVESKTGSISTESDVVVFKGRTVNINQILEQSKRVEAERAEALLKVEQLEHNLKTTKEQRDHYDKKRKRFEDDLDRYKKKLYDAEKCLKNSQDDTVQMKTSLLDVKKLGERLVGIVDKVMPPPPKKEEKKEEKQKEEEKRSSVSKEDSISKEENGKEATENVVNNSVEKVAEAEPEEESVDPPAEDIEKDQPLENSNDDSATSA